MKTKVHNIGYGLPPPSFQVNGETIEGASSFYYLGCMAQTDLWRLSKGLA